MSTCNLLDLQTLGSQPVTPRNLPDHWTDLKNDLGPRNLCEPLKIIATQWFKISVSLYGSNQIARSSYLTDNSTWLVDCKGGWSNLPCILTDELGTSVWTLGLWILSSQATQPNLRSSDAVGIQHRKWPWTQWSDVNGVGVNEIWAI